MKRFLIYFLAATVPLFLVSTLFNLLNLSHAMIRGEAPKLSADKISRLSVEKTPAPTERRTRPLNAAILLSNSGTEITDALGPYEILARSGLFDVYTVAPKRKLSLTVGHLAILPDYSFENAPRPDVLIVPAVSDPDNPQVLKWLKKQAPHLRLLVGVCEGSRVLAEAGLLDGHRATSHFLALSTLENAAQDVHWVSDQRVVIDHGVITSAGVTGSLDAAFAILKSLGGDKVSQKVAQEMGGRFAERVPAESRTLELSVGDWLPSFARGAFDWGRRQLAVLVYPGVSELGLAAALDTQSRDNSFSVTAYSAPQTVHSTQGLIETWHGLKLYPLGSLGPKSWTHVLMIPSGAPEAQSQTPALKHWIAEDEPELVNFSTHKSGTAFQEQLDFLNHEEGPGMTRFVGKMIEFPGLSQTPSMSAADYPARLWIRALMLSALGLVVVFLARFRMEVRQMSAASSEAPSEASTS